METAWLDRAACKGMPLDVFFNSEGGAAAAAKRVCRTCPVIADCLEYAMEAETSERGEPARYDCRAGVYGGLTAMERWAVNFPAAAERKRRYDQQHAASKGKGMPEPKLEPKRYRGKPWSEYTPEEKAKKLADNRARYKTMSPEEKARDRGKVTAEQKRARDRKWLANLSPAERKARNQKTAAWRKAKRDRDALVSEA